MDYNAEKCIFCLDPDEAAMLRLPPGTVEWPLSRLTDLIDGATLASLDHVDENPTTYAPPQRAQAVSEHAARGRRLTQIWRLLAKHTTLSELDFDRLLAG